MLPDSIIKSANSLMNLCKDGGVPYILVLQDGPVEGEDRVAINYNVTSEDSFVLNDVVDLLEELIEFEGRPVEPRQDFSAYN